MVIAALFLENLISLTKLNQNIKFDIKQENL